MNNDITPKKKVHIDDLEQELYDPSKKHEQRARRRIHGRDIELEHDFQDEKYDELIHARPKYKLPTSFFKKLFFVVLIFFVATLAAAGISLYEGQTTVSEELIAMEILGQPFIDGGEELELQVRVQNFNEQNLELPDLVISYAKDSSIDSEKVFLRRSLDDIQPQNRSTEEFDIVLFGQEGDVRTVEATLEYRIEGSSAIFVKNTTHDVIIRSTPTELRVDAPEEIVRNQEMVFAVDVSSNSPGIISNTLLKLDYPRGFEVLRTNIPPSNNNDTWYFDTISSESKRIEVVGRLAGLEGQGQSFNVEYGKQNQFNKNQFETVFNAANHTVEIQKSFIEASLAVNNTNDSTSNIRGGGDVDVELTYRNTLPIALEAVVIEIPLDGDLYDPESIRAARGFYDSSRKVLVYDQSSSDRLRILEPGQEGSLNFSLKAKPLVTAQEILTNPTIDLSVNVKASEGNGVIREALAVAGHVISANSDISLQGKTWYEEGPFKNTGPIAPRVDRPTTYTLVWSVINSSNDVENAKVTTTLPSYVRWLNTISPSIERTNISYNTSSRELTWNVGTIDAGTGVGTNEPEQISMQVEITPSINQLGENPDLTGDILVTGKDVFTDTTLNFRKSPLSTELEGANDAASFGNVRR